MSTNGFGERVRIGDTERDAAAVALGEHFASGRLTREEFDERLDVVWSARTAEDIDPLFSDLPGSGSRTPVQTGKREPVGPSRQNARCGVGGAWRTPFGLPPLLLLVLTLVFVITVITHPYLLFGFAVLWCTGVIGPRRHRRRGSWAHSR